MTIVNGIAARIVLLQLVVTLVPLTALLGGRVRIMAGRQTRPVVVVPADTGKRHNDIDAHYRKRRAAALPLECQPQPPLAPTRRPWQHTDLLSQPISWQS